MPSVLESPSGLTTHHEEVLTLAEAAAYLRVAEKAVAKLADDRAVPSQKIGGEWRFHRGALADWLRFPDHPSQNNGPIQRKWMLESPFTEELLHLLEQRLLQHLKQTAPTAPKPGSKEAVLEHFGVWKDDPTAEAMLAEIYKRRQEPESEE